MTAVLILGQAPGPNGQAPPLDPEQTRTGAWLARVAGLEPAEFRQRFALANVLDYWPGRLGPGDRFPIAAAREAAAGLDLSPYTHVLALGPGIPIALGVRGGMRWMAWREHEHRGHRFFLAAVPHPSGLNKYYSSLHSRRAVRDFMREVVALTETEEGNERVLHRGV